MSLSPSLRSLAENPSQMSGQVGTLLEACLSLAQASTLVELERQCHYWFGRLFAPSAWTVTCLTVENEEPVIKMRGKRGRASDQEAEQAICVPIPLKAGLALHGLLELNFVAENAGDIPTPTSPVLTSLIPVLANSLGHVYIELQSLAQRAEICFIRSLLMNESVNSVDHDLDALANRLLDHLDVSSLQILIAGMDRNTVSWGVSSRRQPSSLPVATRQRLVDLVEAVLHGATTEPRPYFLARRTLLVQLADEYDLPPLANLESLLLVPMRAGTTFLGAVIVAEERSWLRQPISQQAQSVCGLLARSVAGWLAERKLLGEVIEQGRSLQSLVDALGDAVVTTREGSIVTWNNAAQTLFGYDRSEVLGKAIGDVLRGMPPQLLENYHVLRSSASPKVCVEWTMPTTGGVDLQLDCSVTTLYDFDPRVPMVMYVFREVGQERELEYLKEELLSGVSHELRTPLNGIYGFARLLLDRPHMTDSMRRESLESLQSSIERLKRMADDFIDVARARRRRLPLELEVVDVEQTIRSAVRESKRYHLKHSIRLRVQKGLPPVCGDSMRIKQIVDNLISNAAKYSDEGSRIFIDVRQRDKVIALSVSDQGVGIPKAVQERIFEAFYRANNSRHHRATGVGLGLSIVKSLVQAHGGEVRVRSRDGRGTTFTFTLPVATSTIQAAR